MRRPNAASDIVWVEPPAEVSAPAIVPAREPEPPTKKRPVRGVSLDAALRSDRIEFWYQPKINLRRKQLVGVEAFARYCGVDGRVVSAAELIGGASADEIVRLTTKALISALKTSINLSEIGVDIRLAVNVNIPALRRIPIADIVRRYRPDGGTNVNLVFDISESEVLRHIDEVAALADQLAQCGFSLAIDDFGASLLSVLDQKQVRNSQIDRTFKAIAGLQSVEVAEVKLDRTLVRDCATDARRHDVCRHIVELAHSLGSAAVGVGIERAPELKALQQMRCDIGQGYFLGRPMSEERFLLLLWERGVKQSQGTV